MSTTTVEPEVWTSPDGVPCYLTPVSAKQLEDEFFAANPDYDDEYGGDAWYPDFPGQRHPQTYRLLSVNGGRIVEEHTVFPYEPWSWYDAISDMLTRDGWFGPPPTEDDLALCDHGLSARLCAGPMHYPDDRNDW